MKRKIQDKKLREVQDIINLTKKYSVLGLMDMTNLPSLQLQRMRQQLRNTIFLKMSKKRLIRIALEQLKDRENIKELSDKLTGEAALIFTNDDPFKLSKLLAKGKSSAPARAGQKAPNDITIPAGPTNFTPGPIIGELGQLGIKTEVKEGKIAIKEDKLIVKEGEIISPKVADMLSKLGIEPMQVGLNLIAVYENGIVYGKDVLSIDEDTYINNIKQLGKDTFNLALFIGYAAKDTISHLIKKSFRDANALADSRKIPTSEAIKRELAKVEKEAEILTEKLNIEVSKEEKKEETKEKKEEIVREEKKEIPKEQHKEVPQKEERKEEKPKEIREEKKQETKEITTEELLKEAEEETKEERERLQEERKEKEELKKAEEKLRELTDKAIKEKK